MNPARAGGYRVRTAMEELDARQRDILRVIVQEHIATGDPVGSSAIAGRELQV